MNCAWREDQAYRFAEGSMEPDTARAFESHMRECSDCSERANEAQRLETLLRVAIVPVTPPPTLASRVALAVEAEAGRRHPVWSLLPARLSHSPLLTGLIAVLVIGLATTLAAPGAVTALVQRALLFVPGLGISAVEEGYLVATESVSAETSGVRFRVEALLSDGKSTTVKFNVTGLPGGKAGWDKPAQPGDGSLEPAQVERISAPRRAPYLQDESGRRYEMQFSHHGVGGGKEENRIEGEMTFAPLPATLDSIEVVVPMDHLVPPAMVAGSDEQEWVLRVPLAPAAESDLPRATAQGASATDSGVTLRVTASTLERDRTIVLLEGDAKGSEQIMWVGKNGGNLAEEVTLTDNRGGKYELRMDGSRSRVGDAQYSEDLYFAPVRPGVQQLTLAVGSVQLRGNASALVTIDLSGRTQGETFTLNREVRLGEYTVLLESATMRDSWLDVDVDLGPEVSGRTLSGFSFMGRGGWSSSNGAKKGHQMDRFGVEIVPGQETVDLELGYSLVNVEGNWEMSFPVNR